MLELHQTCLRLLKLDQYCSKLLNSVLKTELESHSKKTEMKNEGRGILIANEMQDSSALPRREESCDSRAREKIE